jgi:hypothetical protein
MLALAPRAHADKPRKEENPRLGDDALVERRLSLLFAPGPKPELAAALRTVRPGALLAELRIAASFTMRDPTHIAHPDLEVGPRRAAVIQLELGAKEKDRIDTVRLSINGDVIRLLAKRWEPGRPLEASGVEWLVKEDALRVVAREVAKFTERGFDLGLAARAQPRALELREHRGEVPGTRFRAASGLHTHRT